MESYTDQCVGEDTIAKFNMMFLKQDWRKAHRDLMAVELMLGTFVLHSEIVLHERLREAQVPEHIAAFICDRTMARMMVAIMAVRESHNRLWEDFITGAETDDQNDSKGEDPHA